MVVDFVLEPLLRINFIAFVQNLFGLSSLYFRPFQKVFLSEFDRSHPAESCHPLVLNDGEMVLGTWVGRHIFVEVLLKSRLKQGVVSGLGDVLGELLKG